MRVLVTGAAGFLGRNLCVRLGESGLDVLPYARGDGPGVLDRALAVADAVVHLAGENRPASEEAFELVNVGMTRRLCDAIVASGRSIPLLLASSSQADLDNPYGRSKLRAEAVVGELARRQDAAVAVYRLPGVFGKWCRPNYNSVVATFCHNIARGLPVSVTDPDRALRLVYVDDVVTEFIRWIRDPGKGLQSRLVTPEYATTPGQLAEHIRTFSEARTSLHIGPVGTGLLRALYATYVSYLPTGMFSYGVPAYRDARGVFVEMLKTRDAGQFSYFTARPGVTRGGHYHHTKTEKFLVLKGRARFDFRNIITGETCSLETSGDEPTVVDTIPGWAHDITNIGADDAVVMLWANEVFDRQRPDTVANMVRE
jgi:UDP-2-acetamido-2,6-beta-L-arabino-hexul-4-ose reductase